MINEYEGYCQVVVKVLVAKPGLVVMAQRSGRSNIRWEKDQDVEVYDTSQDKWIIGKIKDIREDNKENMYFVQYEERYEIIHEKDVHSLLRIPGDEGGTNQKSDAIEAMQLLLEVSEQISDSLPLMDQIQILMNSAGTINPQRMISIH